MAQCYTLTATSCKLLLLFHGLWVLLACATLLAAPGMRPSKSSRLPTKRWLPVACILACSEHEQQSEPRDIACYAESAGDADCKSLQLLRGARAVFAGSPSITISVFMGCIVVLMLRRHIARKARASERSVKAGETHEEAPGLLVGSRPAERGQDMGQLRVIPHLTTCVVDDRLKKLEEFFAQYCEECVAGHERHEELSQAWRAECYACKSGMADELRAANAARVARGLVQQIALKELSALSDFWQSRESAACELLEERGAEIQTLKLTVVACHAEHTSCLEEECYRHREMTSALAAQVTASKANEELLHDEAHRERGALAHLEQRTSDDQRALEVLELHVAMCTQQDEQKQQALMQLEKQAHTDCTAREALEQKLEECTRKLSNSEIECLQRDERASELRELLCRHEWDSVQQAQQFENQRCYLVKRAEAYDSKASGIEAQESIVSRQLRTAEASIGKLVHEQATWAQQASAEACLVAALQEQGDVQSSEMVDLRARIDKEEQRSARALADAAAKHRMVITELNSEHRVLLRHSQESESKSNRLQANQAESAEQLLGLQSRVEELVWECEAARVLRTEHEEHIEQLTRASVAAVANYNMVEQRPLVPQSPSQFSALSGSAGSSQRLSGRALPGGIGSLVGTGSSLAKAAELLAIERHQLEHRGLSGQQTPATPVTRRPFIRQMGGSSPAPRQTPG